MTPRPPTHREPTDEEMQRLPEGSLAFDINTGLWVPSELIGKAKHLSLKHLYAVPITKQEPDGMTLRDYFAGQILSDPINLIENYTLNQIASLAYAIADAMLAARNNQPEKV